MNLALYASDAEANAIAGAIQPEFDRQRAEIKENFRQQWIALADEAGIAHWERVLGVTPDLAVDTLEFRRARALRLYNMRPPFNLGWLVPWIHAEYDVQAVGLSWSPEAVTLELRVTTGEPRFVIELRRQLIQIIPANVNLFLMRQLPFPNVGPATSAAFSFAHHMARHVSKGLAWPDIGEDMPGYFDVGGMGIKKAHFVLDGGAVADGFFAVRS